MRQEAAELATWSGLDAHKQASLRGLLGHKGRPWLDHVEDYFAFGRSEVFAGLQWRFHVALVEGKPVASVCVWKGNHTGLLGHVYTHPEHRGRGLARRLMQSALEDFERNNGRALYLNTEADSFQERFYASVGFLPVGNSSGSMVREFRPVERGNKNPTVREMKWSDWPALNAFALSAAANGMSWLAGGVCFPTSIEHSFLRLVYRSAQGAPQARIHIIDSGEGKIEGFGSLTDARRAICSHPEDNHILDVCVPPAHSGLKRKLLSRACAGINEAVTHYTPSERGGVFFPDLNRHYRASHALPEYFIKY